MKHEAIAESFPYFSAPVMYRIRCSCGEYDTGKRVIAAAAEKSWKEHARAKEEQERQVEEPGG